MSMPRRMCVRGEEQIAEDEQATVGCAPPPHSMGTSEGRRLGPQMERAVLL